jgi:hypothetical protein
MENEVKQNWDSAIDPACLDLEFQIARIAANNAASTIQTYCTVMDTVEMAIMDRYGN